MIVVPAFAGTTTLERWRALAYSRVSLNVARNGWPG